MKWLRKLYDWVLSWSESPHGSWALFIVAVAESSFFPVPPDALLIALCMGNYKKWFKFALICSVGSVIGGAIGYMIGMYAYDFIGKHILEFIASLSNTDTEFLKTEAQRWFSDYGAWAVGIAGFTPIPYKVFTISAGFFDMNFYIFIIASIISRSMRFFAVGGLIGMLYKKYGDRIKEFIDKKFNYLAIAFVVLLILGFWTIKWIKG